MHLSRSKRQQYQLAHQPPSNRELDDSNEDDFEIPDFHVAYRRPTIVDEDGDEPLSDYVLDRLKTARMLAMMKYREVHG